VDTFQKSEGCPLSKGFIVHFFSDWNSWKTKVKCVSFDFVGVNLENIFIINFTSDNKLILQILSLFHK